MWRRVRRGEETEIVEDVLSVLGARDCVEMAESAFCAKRRIGVKSIVAGT
jgi:hypothetical protein